MVNWEDVLGFHTVWEWIVFLTKTWERSSSLALCLDHTLLFRSLILPCRFQKATQKWSISAVLLRVENGPTLSTVFGIDWHPSLDTFLQPRRYFWEGWLAKGMGVGGHRTRVRGPGPWSSVCMTPGLSFPLSILFASRWGLVQPASHLFPCPDGLLIFESLEFPHSSFVDIQSWPELFEWYPWRLTVKEKCQMAKKQLSSKTTSMICVLNFRFLYTSVWVHFHELQQWPDTKPLKKSFPEPEMETDGQCWWEQPPFIPSSCSQQWQKVI